MFSLSSKAASYDKTVKNMLINKQTKVVCQGFTGKQVTISNTPMLAFFSLPLLRS